MGREKTILLGVLGLLAGVFVGVLSLKLLVPRPPAGAGPDIRVDVAATTAQELVEPPSPAPVAWDFSSAPPLVPDAGSPLADPPRSSRFTAATPTVADPAVAPASWRQAVEPPAAAAAETLPSAEPPPADFVPAATVPAANDVTQPERPTVAEVDTSSARDPFRTPADPPPSVAVAGTYLVRTGDSWWSLAERAYGDGRLYRALFAWNRGRDPRVTLAPGTRLDVPPLDRLEAAWPRLTNRAASR